VADPVFTGEYEYAVDSQRRVPLPKDWRRELGDSAVLYMYPRDGGIEVMPEALFNHSMMSHIRSMGLRERARIAAKTHRCVCDKQGRITLSQKLMNEVGITDHTLMVGTYVSIFLLPPDNWTPEDQDTSPQMEQLSTLEKRGDFLNPRHESSPTSLGDAK
jgi:DNA-binding transcriptional regulator/RsmH inhibitor MraZ